MVYDFYKFHCNCLAMHEQKFNKKIFHDKSLENVMAKFPFLLAGLLLKLPLGEVTFSCAGLTACFTFFCKSVTSLLKSKFFFNSLASSFLRLSIVFWCTFDCSNTFLSSFSWPLLLCKAEFACARAVVNLEFNCSCFIFSSSNSERSLLYFFSRSERSSFVVCRAKKIYIWPLKI